MEKFFIKLFESKLNRKELCCPEKTPEGIITEFSVSALINMLLNEI
jgi:hypothetical protein